MSAVFVFKLLLFCTLQMSLTSAQMFNATGASQTRVRTIPVPYRCTANGTRCTFPFTYKYMIFNSCTTIENNNVPWCSTTTYFSGQWGNCSECPSETRVRTTPVPYRCTANGTRCAFPFTYKYMIFTSCTTIENNNVPWCSTTTYFSGQWGNCSECPSVQSVLSRLPSFVNAVRNIATTTPQWYSYNYDFTESPITEIRDGGNDMYDGGNRITVSTSNYRFNAIYNQTYSANNGQELFVTYAGHPFVALHYGFPQRTDIYQKIEISGNAGADGFGRVTKAFANTVKLIIDISPNSDIAPVDETRHRSLGADPYNYSSSSYEIPFGAMTYSYFQISGAQDPTICEVYFTIRSGIWNTSWSALQFDFGNNTNKLKNSFLLFNRIRRPSMMGYTLLSRNNGMPYNESEIKEIMIKLLHGLEPENTNLIELLKRYSNSSIQNTIRTTPVPYRCTVNGTPCVFPFSYKNVIYNSCTTIENNNVPWCSTTTYFSGQWGNCSECLSVLYRCTTYGAPCAFPFRYKNVTYDSCATIDNNNIPWCSATSVYDGQWGNCVECPSAK